MSEKWELKLEPQGTEPPSYVIGLGVRDQGTGKVVALIDPCGSIEEFEKEFASLKGEMDAVLREARELIKHFEQELGGGADVAPEKIWREMEQLRSEEEMFSYFNALGGKTRQMVAEYVLTQVNMFRGRGPTFAEHYDSLSHTLD